MNKESKIYIAGHRGLVGSAIWANLVSKGYSNLIGRTHEELDLMDAVAVREFFSSEKPEYVVLAAAYVGGIKANNQYRADFIYRNLGIQQNVIGECHRQGVKKLLFLGSSCIYPREANQPIGEEELLQGPLEYTNEPYAIAKIAGLKMCGSFNIQYGTNFIAVMPTNLYGPGDNFDLETSHVLPAMVRKMHLAKALHNSDWASIRADLNRRPVLGVSGIMSEQAIEAVLASQGIGRRSLALWGSGTPLREFLWSEDMADASVFILEKVDFKDTYDSNESQIRNCHINIGSGKEVSIAELAQMIAAEVQYEGEILFNPNQPDGTMRKLSDVSKLHALGWQHRVELDEGIARIYQWYRESIRG